MLLECRRVAGLTQEELAEAAGLSARSVRDLEQGRRGRPQRRTVEQLVSALGLVGTGAAELLAAGRPGRPADRGREGAVLLDRTEQLAVLERAADGARAGQGAVVLVCAGAGMGKTSLLNAWAGAEQARGMRVVRADSGELEQDFAFSVLRQLIEPLLARADQAGRERLLSGPAELATYALRVDGADGGPGLSPDASLGVLHSLYWLMVHVADDGPLALVVDDAHWADVPSVRWLEYLARRMRGLPLLVVLAARPDAGRGSSRCWSRSAPRRTAGPWSCRPWPPTVWPRWCERGWAGTPIRGSPPPAPRRPGAIPCCCASCCGRWPTTGSGRPAIRRWWWRSSGAGSWRALWSSAWRASRRRSACWSAPWWCWGTAPAGRSRPSWPGWARRGPGSSAAGCSGSGCWPPVTRRGSSIPWSAPRSPKPSAGRWSWPTDMPRRPNCSGARGCPKRWWRLICCWLNRTVRPGGWTSCGRRRGPPAAGGHRRSP
ncbi:AAA family ATPase [Kitasatospora sp. NBC_01266]|uniref:AAA family ATPase n=1 Tax=Kitasatospora sp. NBC_01266 TaxID=2903572 RepID=UPI003FA54215